MFFIVHIITYKPVTQIYSSNQCLEYVIHEWPHRLTSWHLVQIVPEIASLGLPPLQTPTDDVILMAAHRVIQYRISNWETISTKVQISLVCHRQMLFTSYGVYFTSHQIVYFFKSHCVEMVNSTLVLEITIHCETKVSQLRSNMHVRLYSVQIHFHYCQCSDTLFPGNRIVVKTNYVVQQW